ncbi:hydrocephalus-inducing protein [Xylocopa sonorina]|uniref:hydrocephalus-inducing protein n=1 Tax=Xylocopa sonorina TaxID=1818115 RepID=UPI00403B02EE
MYDLVVAQMNENLLARSALAVEPAPQPDIRPKMYSILRWTEVGRRIKKTHGDVYRLVSLIPEALSVDESTHVSEHSAQENLSDRKGNHRRGQRSAGKMEEQKSTSKTAEDRSLHSSTIESRDTNNVSIFEAILEEPLKPRWILPPNESQRFKISFQPEVTGHHEETYAFTVSDGNNDTYEVNVSGIADIPRLDMNPDAIFANTVDAKLTEVDSPVYINDRELYDFGSLLLVRGNKRPHRRDAPLKFRNVSEVEAEARFWLGGNSPECFTVQPSQLLIPPAGTAALVLSAIAVRLGIITGRLYFCLRNNPRVEAIEMQVEGTKLDIELSEKEISFGRALLYRTEYRTLTVRNRTPVPLFWDLKAEEPIDPQITFAPCAGVIELRGEEDIQFCYRAATVGAIQKTRVIFEAFLHTDDEDPIFTDVVSLSAEAYDVTVDINYANPVDLKCVKVNTPTEAMFTMKNRGDYEVKYAITLEDNERLQKLNLPGNFKRKLEVQPSTGTISANREGSVQVILKPKAEMTLKEAPILKCHLIDTHKETTIIAEIPIKVSLVAYYSRCRVHPYPTIDFGTLAICTEKTIYLNIENTGKFPLHYSIQLLHKYPSVMYMSRLWTDDLEKELTSKRKKAASRKGKRSSRTDKTEVRNESERLTLGPMTIMRTEGNVDVGQTDSVPISCYPEFVGSQDEQITIMIENSAPEDSAGKIVTLCVNSCIPTVDFQNLDSIFQENHVVDRIQDFDCPKNIGPHTVFAREEKCLYFRYINVLSTHVTCFTLHNRGIVAASVAVRFMEESLTPVTAKPNTFLVEPRSEQIPPMSHKVFTVSFTPHVIETFRGAFQATVVLPSNLEVDQLHVKLVGESCVPEVAITEPAHGARDTPTLCFVRTLIDEASRGYFTMENVGFIKAKVIVEIDGDQENVFLFNACVDTMRLLQVWEDYCDESHDRCAVVRLAPGNVARFKVTFSPTEIGKHHGKIRLHVTDNPYENLTINLEGECYVESIVLDGLPFEDNKRKVSIGIRDGHKPRKVSSKQNSLVSASSNPMFPVSLTYILDYGLCFISKMYKKTFKIVNKSTDRWFRFQWNVHPHVVFVPSIGHIKYLTSKEIVATFLASEPTNHENTCIDCFVCEIITEHPTDEVVWDDRQTEVRWKRLHENLSEPSDLESLAKKIVEPTVEARHEVVPGTGKSIQLLLSAAVAFSDCSCDVKEIHFKDTLMFQTREYTFTLSNPGIVNTMYVWKINMDEQYPKRHIGDGRNVTSTPTTAEGTPNRRSRGIFSATSESRSKNQAIHKENGDTANLSSKQCMSLVSGSVDTRTASSTRPSDLFSSNAGLSERSNDSWLEGDDLPFAIHPEMGAIPPGQSVECTLKFSPKDVFYYKAYLTCKVENLDPQRADLRILILARSLLPYCHFDVQESDYVTGGRRDPSRPGPVGYEIDDPTLWRNIRVIEFKVVGVGETHVKKFHLINPTTDDYRFSWRDRTLRGTDEISNFHCTVTDGVAERGKRTDLGFTFLAEELGVFESFWLFSIDRYNLECLFLLVGVVTEPSVHCLTVHVKLKPTILGFNVKESIRILNNEDFSVGFKIVEESLYSEGKLQKVSVTPMTGSLVPKTEQHLWVEYHPSRVGEFHFSIQCAVKLMKSPLSIFVTASVYDIVSSVSYCRPNGDVVQAIEGEGNVIDLGKLMLEVPVTIKFDITNIGKVAFYYTWELGMTPEIESRNAYNVTMSQKQGHVMIENRCSCYLTLTTYRKATIRDHCVLLKIFHGSTYKFLLKAVFKRPAVEFSFSRYDFGLCYVQKNNAISYYAELRLTNSDSVPYVIECKYEEKPHLSIDVNCISEALAGHASIAIPIIFRPLKETKYHDCLLFTINSAIEKRITITGQGIGYKVRLVNPRDKSIDLGNVPASRSVTKRIPVVNEGLAPLELKFGLMKQLSGYDEQRERLGRCDLKHEDANGMAMASILETKRSWTIDHSLDTREPHISDVLTIEPSSNVTLNPSKRVNVSVTFKPTTRMRPFAAKVALQSSSMILPLFILHGSCVGTQFRLNRTHIPFGTTVQGYAKETKVVLMNTGDLGSRFKWNTSKLTRDFEISPISGYCSAGVDVSFAVKFQPSEQRGLIEGEAIVDIENHEPLRLKITGVCSKLPEPIETIQFECMVREKQERSVVVMNDTNSPWKLKPQVIGDYFFVEEVLQIPPQEYARCVVTYAPLVTNSEHTLHLGTLTLKSLDENLFLLYSLCGRSLPPQATAKIVRRFPAKTKYTELLPVYNWLNNQQRFRCDIELLKDDSNQTESPLYSFVGNERIDVPGNSQRDYRVVFYCYKEWNFSFKVTFTNDEKEYQFYEIEYEVTEPEVIQSIKLATPARSQLCHALKLENPLEQDMIEYSAECLHPFVTLSRVPIIVQPLSHEFLHINYHPTLPIDQTVTLNVVCKKLGLFPYELRLKATPAALEKVTRVNATLGSSCTFTLPVKNLTRDITTFLIDVDSDCFECRKDISTEGLSDGVIDVIYEPCDVGNVSATLVANSDIAGEFVFPLVGSCGLPKPMGPYVVTRGSPAVIPFKNVFRETKTFNFLLDVPESFMVDPLSVNLNSKQGIEIKVNIKEDEQNNESVEDKYPVTGKLIVYCTDHELSNVNWTYYLRGIFE